MRGAILILRYGQWAEVTRKIITSRLWFAFVHLLVGMCFIGWAIIFEEELGFYYALTFNLICLVRIAHYLWWPHSIIYGVCILIGSMAAVDGSRVLPNVEIPEVVGIVFVGFMLLSYVLSVAYALTAIIYE